MGNRGVEVFQSLDGDGAAGVLGIGQLEKAVQQVSYEMFLNAFCQTVYRSRRVGLAESGVYIFNDSPSGIRREMRNIKVGLKRRRKRFGGRTRRKLK